MPILNKSRGVTAEYGAAVAMAEALTQDSNTNPMLPRIAWVYHAFKCSGFGLSLVQNATIPIFVCLLVLWGVLLPSEVQLSRPVGGAVVLSALPNRDPPLLTDQALEVHMNSARGHHSF